MGSAEMNRQTGEPEELDRLIENIMTRLDEEDSRIYSRKVIEEFRNPSNVGPIEDCDGHGLADGLCNDTMEMFVKLDGDRITGCSFLTDGCGATIACGSRLTRMVKGKTLAEAANVSPKELVASLGGLPDDHIHCASLAVIALRNAIRACKSRRGRDPHGG
jgi:nitrogen fixation NifU-like protein